MAHMTAAFWIVLGIVCLAGCAGVILYAVRRRRAKASQEAASALPIGGEYRIRAEGMDGWQGKFAAESALMNRFPAITANADAETGEIIVRYAGIPSLDFCDELKECMEAAGFSVTEIHDGEEV